MLYITTVPKSARVRKCAPLAFPRQGLEAASAGATSSERAELSRWEVHLRLQLAELQQLAGADADAASTLAAALEADAATDGTHAATDGVLLRLVAAQVGRGVGVVTPWVSIHRGTAPEALMSTGGVCGVCSGPFDFDLTRYGS